MFIFAFVMLGAQQNLADQWFACIHLFNQVFLFDAGVVAKFSSGSGWFCLGNRDALTLLVICAGILLNYEGVPDMI